MRRDRAEGTFRRGNFKRPPHDYQMVLQVSHSPALRDTIKPRLPPIS